MATYPPPTETLPIFDAGVFTTNDTSLTIATADARYLKFPLGQGTETLPNLVVSGTATASSFVGALTGNASTATTSTNIAGGSAGKIPYQTGSGLTDFTAVGTAGYVLTSNGTSAPTWSAGGGGGAGTLSTTLALGNTASNSIALNNTSTSGTNVISLLPNASASNPTITLTDGTTTNTIDKNGYTTRNTSANATHYINFSDSSATGTGSIQKTAGISLNPSTNTITATTFVGALTGNASTATSATSATTASNAGFATSSTNATFVAITDSTATAGTFFPMFVNSAGTANPARIDTTGLAYVPTTNTLTATTFVGALTGNADTSTTSGFAGSCNFAGEAISITGGSAGKVPYQTGFTTTAFTAVGTAGQVLTSQGTSAPTWTSVSGGGGTLSATLALGNTATNSIALNNSGTGSNIISLLPNASASNPTITLTDGTTTNTIDKNGITTRNTSANATHYINFSDSSATGTGSIQKTAGISLNPSTNTITATTFVGALTGNASTASTATTAGSATSAITASFANSATQITITDSTATAGTFLPVFVNSAGSSMTARVDSTGLNYTPSTDTLTCTNFAGNASTATSATSATSATTATTAGTATNIAGGLGGSIPYQTAVDTTALLANGTAGYVLTSQGGTLAPTWSAGGGGGAGTLSATLALGNTATNSIALNNSGTGSNVISLLPNASASNPTITLTDGTTTNTIDKNGITTRNTSANATHYINFSDSSATGTGAIQKTAGISVNPSTNTITATALASTTLTNTGVGTINDIIIKKGLGTGGSQVVGISALANAGATSSNNVVFGHSIGSGITTGSNNTLVGWGGFSAGDAGFNNSFGNSNGTNVTSGSSNTFCGGNVLINLNTGNANTAIGFASGGSLTSGSNNTFLGNGTSTTLSSCARSTAIGYNAIITASDQIVLGTSSQNVVILGTATAPTFVGALTGNASTATTATKATNIAGGLGGSIPYQTAVDTTALLANGTAGQVLTSQGTTLAPTWASASTPSYYFRFVASGTFNNGTNVLYTADTTTPYYSAGYTQANYFQAPISAVYSFNATINLVVSPQTASNYYCGFVISTASAPSSSNFANNNNTGWSYANGVRYFTTYENMPANILCNNAISCTISLTAGERLYVVVSSSSGTTLGLYGFGVGVTNVFSGCLVAKL